jgi:hypothetical protein
MKKDVIIAVIIGFFLGGGAALIITNIPNIYKLSSQTTIDKISSTVSPEPQISQGTNSSQQLSIDKPENGIISKEKIISIEGKTAPGNIVTVQSDFDMQLMDNKSDGTFSGKISLGEGVNQISIFSYNETGEEDSKNISVFYTPEKL